MTVSDAFKEAIFAQETGEAFIVLIEVDHADLASPIYICSGGSDITSNSQLYTFLPFVFIGPSSMGNKEPEAKIEIDNISRAIVEAIRVLTTAPTLFVSIIRESAPDTVEISFPVFLLYNIYYDKYILSGNLVIGSLANEPFPAHTFTPAYFPGLFGGTV